MELNNDFRVSVGPSEAWKVLSDVERIAPLLPGAQLQEVEGDDYRGIVKVKVGPITAQYKGTATFMELDEAAGRMVLKATGRDTRGQGNASAMVTVTMSPDGEGTKVNVSTDLTITGKVAQFGRGVLADVSGKLIGQFVDALEADLEAGGVGTVATAEAIVDAVAGDAVAGEAAAGESAASESAAPLVAAEDAPAVTPLADTVTVTPPSAGPRKIDSPEPEPVDLLDAAGGTVAKRLLPLLGGAAAVAVLVVVLRRRSRRTKLGALRAALPDRSDLPSIDQLRRHLPDLPDRGDLPSIDQLRRHLPDLPDLPAAQELGRRAAKRAKKAARRR